MCSRRFQPDIAMWITRSSAEETVAGSGHGWSVEQVVFETELVAETVALRCSRASRGIHIKPDSAWICVKPTYKFSTQALFRALITLKTPRNVGFQRKRTLRKQSQNGRKPARSARVRHEFAYARSAAATPSPRSTFTPAPTSTCSSAASAWKTQFGRLL